MPRKRVQRDYESLDFEGAASFKTARPSFLDALDILSRNDFPLGKNCALVNVLSTRLPSGTIASFVSVSGPGPERPTVHLPTCSAITASDTFGKRTSYDPRLFQGAQIDEDGSVILRTDVYLHNCEVVPERLAPDWTREKEDLVFQLIMFLGVEKECLEQLVFHPRTNWVGFVPLGSSPTNDPETVYFDQFSINYETVRSLNLHQFKLDAFLQFHKETTKQCKQHLARQTVSNILRHAGIRLPRSSSSHS